MAPQKPKFELKGAKIVTPKIEQFKFPGRGVAPPKFQPIPGAKPIAPTPPPVRAPAPQPPPAPAETPILVPKPSEGNPFRDLPFPSPGDRIKADDFKKLSQGLKIIFDANALSSSLFGHNFGEVKLALASQQYQIQRVMSVFGTEIENVADESLDNRKVIQVWPMTLGERQVVVVLTEAVETRRFAPNLLGLTYREASERLRAVLGEITFPTTPMSASQLVGLALTEAKEAVS